MSWSFAVLALIFGFVLGMIVAYVLRIVRVGTARDLANELFKESEEQLLQIMLPCILGATLVGELVPARPLGDACLQSTFDGKACEVVAAAIQASREERLSLPHPLLRQPLEVSPSHHGPQSPPGSGPLCRRQSYLIHRRTQPRVASRGSGFLHQAS